MSSVPDWKRSRIRHYRVEINQLQKKEVQAAAAGKMGRARMLRAFIELDELIIKAIREGA